MSQNQTVCGIANCMKKASIRNYESLIGKDSFWQLKPQYSSMDDNSKVKICIDHYNEDLKLFRRPPGKKRGPPPKTTTKQQPQKTVRKEIVVDKSIVEPVFIFSLANDPWYKFSTSLFPPELLRRQLLEGEAIFLESNTERFELRYVVQPTMVSAVDLHNTSRNCESNKSNEQEKSGVDTGVIKSSISTSMSTTSKLVQPMENINDDPLKADVTQAATAGDNLDARFRLSAVEDIQFFNSNLNMRADDQMNINKQKNGDGGGNRNEITKKSIVIADKDGRYDSLPILEDFLGWDEIFWTDKLVKFRSRELPIRKIKFLKEH